MLLLNRFFGTEKGIKKYKLVVTSILKSLPIYRSFKEIGFIPPNNKNLIPYANRNYERNNTHYRR